MIDNRRIHEFVRIHKFFVERNKYDSVKHTYVKVVDSLYQLFRNNFVV